MSICFCGVLLAVLVIVFAWVDTSWSPIVLTVLGVLLAIKSLVGKFCCLEMIKNCCCTKPQQSEKDVD